MKRKRGHMDLEQSLEASADEARRMGIDRIVVGAAVVAEGLVLLLRRSGDDYLPGLLELPSGEVEEGETALAAIHREVREETGLRIRASQILPSFDYRSRSGRRTRQLNVAALRVGEDPVVLSEHDSHQWLPLGHTAATGVSEQVNSVLRSCARLYDVD